MTGIWLFVPLLLVLALRPHWLLTYKGTAGMMDPYYDRMVRIGGWTGLAVFAALFLSGVLPFPGAAS